MKKIMIVFGTRPEAIKMVPIIKEMNKRKMDPVICLSGQHRELVDEIFDSHHIKADFDLNIMKKQQDLFYITVEVISRIKEILHSVRPDIVLVHGDTTTAYSTALACFYSRIPVGHIESGLRTGDLYNPFPEEFNRRSISILSSFHFAPTENAKNNLINEGIDPARIFVTGNSIVDAVYDNYSSCYYHKELEHCRGKKIIIVTLHRRELSNNRLENILLAIKSAVEEYDDIKVLCPVHPSPEKRKIFEKIWGQSVKNIRICDPIPTVDFHNILARSSLVLTDSGGVQEVATALGIPVIVAREKTERVEGVNTGAIIVAGTDGASIKQLIRSLIENEEKHRTNLPQYCPFGDGNASKLICDCIQNIK